MYFARDDSAESKLFVLDKSLGCFANPCHAPSSYGHAGMVHIWCLDQGDAMHDDLKGKAMDMILRPPSVENHMLSVGPLLIAYLKQARWKITRTDRCTNRGIHVCKGRF